MRLMTYQRQRANPWPLALLMGIWLGGCSDETRGPPSPGALPLPTADAGALPGDTAVTDPGTIVLCDGLNDGGLCDD